MEFEGRSLKRKEVKALKAKGYNMGNLRPEQVDDLMDEIFLLVFTPEQIAELDERDQKDCMKILNQIIAETSGSVSPDDAKN